MTAAKTKIWLHIIAMTFVVIGSLNWLLFAFGINAVLSLNRGFTAVFKRNLWVDKIIYVLVGISAIYLASQRDTWLPFLGDTAFPASLIATKTNTGTQHIDIQTGIPHAKVAYWAAHPPQGTDTGKTPVEDAYGDYGNSGVVLADGTGRAVLTFDRGSSYVVPTGNLIQSHVHYRVIHPTGGLISPVQTAYISPA